MRSLAVDIGHANHSQGVYNPWGSWGQTDILIDFEAEMGVGHCIFSPWSREDLDEADPLADPVLYMLSMSLDNVPGSF